MPKKDLINKIIGNQELAGKGFFNGAPNCICEQTDIPEETMKDIEKRLEEFVTNTAKDFFESEDKIKQAIIVILTQGENE